MSNQALDLLIEYELLKPNGSPVKLESLPDDEVSRRISSYINARRQCVAAEIDHHVFDSKLNAQFSTWSSKFSKENTLSSLLVYNKLVLDDPLVSSRSGISLKQLTDGLEFYSWLHPLIRTGFVTTYPIGYYEKPSDKIPMLYSEDAFRSSISPAIHDYAHKNATLKSVRPDNDGSMLVLREEASLNRRTALNVEFLHDRVYSGVTLFKYATMEDVKFEGENFSYRQYWDPNLTLSEDTFKRWSYQAVNQAVVARLKSIVDQTALAQKLGHTYITESKFESELLSLSNTQDSQLISPCINFINLNHDLINIESPSVIIELRERYPEAFERFNATLMAASEELHNTSEANFDKKCQSILHNEILPQVDEVRSTIGQIGSGLVKGTLASFCGLGMAISTGSAVPLIPSLLLSASQGLTETVPALRELQLHKKRPGYIWHRLTKR